MNIPYYICSVGIENELLCQDNVFLAEAFEAVFKAVSAAAAAAATAVPGFNNFSSLSLIRLYDSLRDFN